MNIEELFNAEIYHSYGLLTTEYLKAKVTEHVVELEKRITELKGTISQLNKADASLRAQNEAQGRNAAASAKRIAELEEALEIATHWLEDEVPPYIIRQIKEVLQGGEA